MKEIVLKKLPELKCYNQEEILNIEVESFVNSDFKNSLKKDINRGAKLSSNKFYLQVDGVLIRVQFDEEIKRLVIQLSKDNCNLKQLKDFVSLLEKQNVNKIDFFCNSSFIETITFLRQRNYETELERKDKFFNSGFENLVVLSKFKGVQLW